MSYYARSIGDCIGTGRIVPSSPLLMQPAGGLSGIPESTFAAMIGTSPDYASNLSSAVKLVYVRANYNANISANGGSLPWKPTTYYSEKLVSAVIDTYRKLSGTGVVRHLTPETISTADATDTYNQVVGKLLVPYSNLKTETVRQILREFFYATVDQKIDPEILLPAIERYPTAGASAMMSQQEQTRKNQEEKEALEKQGFFGQIGAAVMNIFRAPGDLASAATTTAKVAGIGAAVVILGGTSLLVIGIYKKITQFDVNANYKEVQKTVRKVGPDVAQIAMTKGMKR